MAMYRRDNGWRNRLTPNPLNQNSDWGDRLYRDPMVGRTGWVNRLGLPRGGPGGARYEPPQATMPSWYRPQENPSASERNRTRASSANDALRPPGMPGSTGFSYLGPSSGGLPPPAPPGMQSFMGQLDTNLSNLRYQKSLESALGHSRFGFRQSALLPGSGIGGIAADFGRSILGSASSVSKSIAALSGAGMGLVYSGAMTPFTNTLLDAADSAIAPVLLAGGKSNGVSYKDALRTSWQDPRNPDPEPRIPEWIQRRIPKRFQKPITVGGAIGLDNYGGLLSSARLEAANLADISRMEVAFDEEFGRHRLSNLTRNGPRNIDQRYAGRRRTYGYNNAGMVVTREGDRLYKEALRNIDMKGFHKRAPGDKVFHSAYAHIIGSHYQEGLGIFRNSVNSQIAAQMRKNVLENVLGLRNGINITGDVVLQDSTIMTDEVMGVMRTRVQGLGGVDLNAHMAGRNISPEGAEQLRKALMFKGNGEGGPLKKIANLLMPDALSGAVFNSNEAMQILAALPESVRQQVLAPATSAERRAAEGVQSGITRAYASKLGVDASEMTKLREPTVAGLFQSKRMEMLNRRTGRQAGIESAEVLAVANKTWMKEFAMAGAFGGLDLAFNIMAINDAETKKEVMDATVSGMYTATVGAYLFGSGAVGAWMKGGARAGGAVGNVMGRGAGGLAKGLFAVGRRIPGLNMVINPALRYGGMAANRLGLTAAIQGAAGSAAGRTAASYVAARGGAAAVLGGGVGRVLGGALGLGGPMTAIMAYDIGTSLMDAAYENKMMEREKMMQWNAAAHLSTPEAKMILTTERQKASMFARQAGMNFVAAQGEEAVLFHQ